MKELASAARPVRLQNGTTLFPFVVILLGGSDLIGPVCVKYYEPLNVFKFYVSSFHNNSKRRYTKTTTNQEANKKNGAINIRSGVGSE